MYTLDDSILSIKEWIDGGGLEEKAERKETYGEGVKE